jgi:hypothetical protein
MIGMEVKNPAGEELGKIGDIVIDFKTDKVAYCVLRVGGPLGIGEKLLAVPLRAFEPSMDRSYLVLHADKENLAHAEGFDHHHWPSVSNPPWGAESLWKEPQGVGKPLQETPAPQKPPQNNNP